MEKNEEGKDMDYVFEFVNSKLFKLGSLYLKMGEKSKRKELNEGTSNGIIPATVLLLIVVSCLAFSRLDYRGGENISAKINKPWAEEVIQPVKETKQKPEADIKAEKI